jgi:hypothetical protein
VSEFTTSGSTSFGTGSGCSSGAFCTSGTSGGGGTYTSSFDVPLTEAELQQGFTLNSGITVNSHPSNSALSTCESIMQSSDCRDIFRLSITLSDDGTVVESFSHQEELDFSGLRDFTFSDVVAANDYGVLTGVLELFGIDAGYPSGFYGPQFSNPGLTIDYQLALVAEEVVTIITDQIEIETQEIIQEAVETEVVPVVVEETPEPVIVFAILDTTVADISIITESSETVPSTETDTTLVTLEPLVESVPALPTFSTGGTLSGADAPGPPTDVVPVVTMVDVPTPTVTAASTDSAPPSPPETPTAPVIAPIAPSSEAQQEQSTSAEAEIEAAVEAPTETLAEAPSEVSSEAPAETSEEVSAEAPAAASEDTSEETSAEATSESAEESESKAASKPTKSASRRKVASTASSAAPAVPAPVTLAVAAQSVVDAIAPSQKYGSAAQTLTLVAMGIIAQNQALFKGAGIPDAPVGFFPSTTVPDGPSMVDRMQNYRIFGQANGVHQRLVESQWGK